MDENGFLGNVDEIEGSLFLRISVERTIVNWTRAVALFEVSNPIRNVAVSSHDRGKITSLEFEFFIRHDFTSAYRSNIDNEAHSRLDTPTNR